jgi:hypothetical protein
MLCGACLQLEPLPEPGQASNMFSKSREIFDNPHLFHEEQKNNYNISILLSIHRKKEPKSKKPLS